MNRKIYNWLHPFSDLQQEVGTGEEVVLDEAIATVAVAAGYKVDVEVAAAAAEGIVAADTGY
jgi:hypothetical protein